MDDWREILEEARDRLMEGIAEDVDDVLDQLVDEGLIAEYERAEYGGLLEAHR